MSGHETPEEKKYIEDLEKKIDLDNSSIEAILELSILYIDPSHREDEAIMLLKTVLKRDPKNEKAKILLAHCCIHYLMDKNSLLYAETLLNEIISGSGNYIGAAYNLLPSVLGELYKIPISQKINYFELSVKNEYSWVSNHYNLAFSYKQAGRFEEAISEIKTAIRNVVPPDPKWSMAETYYEGLITGRGENDFFLRSELYNIEKEFEKKNRRNIKKKLKNVVSFIKSIFKKI